MTKVRWFTVVVLFSVACATSDPVSEGEGGSDGAGSANGGSPPTTNATAGESAVGGEGGGVPLGGAGGTGGAAPTCGDGSIDLGESCDDQNSIAGDGCSSCTIDCGPGEIADPASDHCYGLFLGPIDRPGAEAACQAWGGAPDLGHLASIDDAAQNALVAPLLTGDAWIGADDLGGDWAWNDGTPYSFENWQRGEPNFPGVEHCMFMDLEARWHDHDCADLRAGYLCERRGAGTF